MVNGEIQTILSCIFDKFKFQLMVELCCKKMMQKLIIVHLISSVNLPSELSNPIILNFFIHRYGTFFSFYFSFS